MRNLWIFLSKYNAFFFFVIFFTGSLILTLQNNTYQKAIAVNSSNETVGRLYFESANLKSYLNLGHVSDSLAAENARLRNLLKTSFYNDSVKSTTIKDTLFKQQFTHIEAVVINNSVQRRDNVITLDKGRLHGIERGMGVICPQGVVGTVLNVSDRFATVQSILNSNFRISASIAENQAFGSLIWGQNEYDPRYATLIDIPNHINVKKGQTVVTSQYSLFPQNIPIGKIIQTGAKSGDSFFEIKVRLFTDFSTLRYVYVIKNKFSAEQQELENQGKKDE